MKRVGLYLVVVTILGMLAGCGPEPTPQVVEKVVEVEVTRVVEETVIETVIVEGTPEVVEKIVTKTVQEVVTATPAPEEPADTSKYGGILNRQMMGITQFDPIYIEDSTHYATSNIFSSLFRLDSQTGEAFPDLATSWEWEDDSTIVFHLRQGVMWHDDNEVFAAGESREVTADDVVYSIKRHIETEGSAPPADLRPLSRLKRLMTIPLASLSTLPMPCCSAADGASPRPPSFPVKPWSTLAMNLA